MPFHSKRQWRAAMGGHIPGISKSEAHEWAHESKDFKRLPDRAPDEKGKPTLRSKKANGDMLAYFQEHPKKAENYLDRKERDRRKSASLFDGLEDDLTEMFKTAALGTAAMKSSNVGRLRGMMTANAMKPAGYAAKKQATLPRRNIADAMNATKPHGSL